MSITIQVRPRFSCEDMGNRASVHTKLQGCFRGCFSRLAHLYYFCGLFHGKFCVVTTLSKLSKASTSFTKSVSSFLNHVGNVVLGCPKKEMCWVHANPVVAMVTNKHSSRNLSEVNLPRKAMTGYWSGIKNTPITLDIFSSSPLPTSVRLFNLRPEPIEKISLYRLAPFLDEHLVMLWRPFHFRIHHYVNNTIRI